MYPLQITICHKSTTFYTADPQREFFCQRNENVDMPKGAQPNDLFSVIRQTSTNNNVIGTVSLGDPVSCWITAGKKTPKHYPPGNHHASTSKM